MLIKTNRVYYIFRDAFKNKWRLFLSLSGISLALVILITSYILIDSYYNAQFNSIKHYKENNIVHYKINNYSGESGKIDDYLSYIEKKNGDNYLILKNSLTIGMREELITDDGFGLNIILNIYKTNQNFNGTIVSGNNNCNKVKLIDGRGFNQEDINEAKNVIIIDSITADILFDGDSIGKIIKIPLYKIVNEEQYSHILVDGYTKYEVIGVYKKDISQYVEFNNMVKETKEDEYATYDAQCYIPMTCNIDESESDSVEIIYLNSEGLIGEDVLIDNYSVAMSKELSYECKTYESLAKELSLELKSIKFIINIVTIVIIIISMIIINQTMIFSIKENLSEYGIKKALGASESKLATDIIIEMLIYGILAYLVALVFSIIISLICLNLIKEIYLCPISDLIVKNDTLILSFLIAITTSMMSSLTPIAYMSKKTIVDIIKFE